MRRTAFVIAADRETANHLPPSREYGRFLSASLLDEATEGWPPRLDSPNLWLNEADAMLRLLQFRHDMLKELAP
jgi:hypothetical protein